MTGKWYSIDLSQAKLEYGTTFDGSKLIPEPEGGWVEAWFPTHEFYIEYDKYYEIEIKVDVTGVSQPWGGVYSYLGSGPQDWNWLGEFAPSQRLGRDVNDTLASGVNSCVIGPELRDFSTYTIPEGDRHLWFEVEGSVSGIRWRTLTRDEAMQVYWFSVASPIYRIDEDPSYAGSSNGYVDYGNGYATASRVFDDVAVCVWTTRGAGDDGHPDVNALYEARAVRYIEDDDGFPQLEVGPQSTGPVASTAPQVPNAPTPAEPYGAWYEPAHVLDIGGGRVACISRMPNNEYADYMGWYLKVNETTLEVSFDGWIQSPEHFQPWSWVSNPFYSSDGTTVSVAMLTQRADPLVGGSPEYGSAFLEFSRSGGVTITHIPSATTDYSDVYGMVKVGGQWIGLTIPDRSNSVVSINTYPELPSGAPDASSPTQVGTINQGTTAYWFEISSTFLVPIGDGKVALFFATNGWWTSAENVRYGVIDTQDWSFTYLDQQSGFGHDQNGTNALSSAVPADDGSALFAYWHPSQGGTVLHTTPTSSDTYDQTRRRDVVYPWSATETHGFFNDVGTLYNWEVFYLGNKHAIAVALVNEQAGTEPYSTPPYHVGQVMVTGINLDVRTPKIKRGVMKVKIADGEGPDKWRIVRRHHWE